MSDGEDALMRLAGALGIEDGYEDVWGVWQPLKPATARALLAAMGVRADSDRAVEARLAEEDALPWRRVLPPVVSIPAGVRSGVDLTLHEPPSERMSWTVRQADGASRAGDEDLSALPLMGAARLRGRGLEHRRLALPPLPPGRHRLRVLLHPDGSRRNGACILDAVPAKGHTADAALGPGGRCWGLSVQLYGLRSADNWGIGDFADLGRLAEVMAGLGADFVGINPIHAGFAADPGHFGPYGPSHRSFLNILAIAVPDVPDMGEGAEVRAVVDAPAFAARIAAARSAELVDYAEVGALKLAALGACWRHFQKAHLDRGTLRDQIFKAFRAERGEALDRFALFEALHGHIWREQGGPWNWADWPGEFQGPGAPGAAAFATDHPDRVLFHAWMQWEADRQLGLASARARAAGMRVGIYRDLAVANDPGGAAAWAAPDVVLRGASVGAPPDLFAPKGQDWGLAPMSPLGLREHGYGPFVDDLAATMRHAGAVRIDHAMALQHLYWVPHGSPASDGAYVAYPFEGLLGALKLLSVENRTLVVGEDLGTVPQGFRETMVQAGALSTRLLIFERDGEAGFTRPGDYEPEALVMATTHDLPTLRGWWAAHDVGWRERLGLFTGPGQASAERAERAAGRRHLLDALAAEDLLPDGTDGTDPPPDTMPASLLPPIHRFLARTPCRLLAVTFEDMAGEIEQPNLPGTTDQHPNWRRRPALALEEIAADPGVRAIADALNAERPRPATGVGRG